ncbi:MAG: hypothetical protein V4561_05570 [Bacteroidota bacterium]
MNKLYYKLFISAALIAVCNVAQAQSYELKVNEMEKNKVRPSEFIGKDNQGNLLVSATSPKIKMYLPLMLFNYVNIDVKKYIKKYDKDLKVIGEQQVTSQNPLIRQSQINGKATLTSVLGWVQIVETNTSLPNFMLGGKYYMVIQDAKKPRNNYSIAEVDMETGFVTQSTHILSLSKSKNEKTLKVKSFSVKFSPDSSHILFMATYQKDKATKTGVAYSSAVFSKDMKPVFASNYSLPKASNKYTIKDAKLTNQGEVLILGRYFDKKQKQNPGYISVYSVNQASIKPKESRLKFSGNYVNDAVISLNKSNEPLVMGFYKTKANAKGYDGMFYAALNEQRELSEMTKQKFNAEFIASDHTESYAKKLSKKEKKGKAVREDNDFGFSEFIPTSDGGYLAIAENYYVQKVTRTTTSSKGVVTKREVDYHHHYDDMMVFKYDKEGNLQTMNKVAKQTVYISKFPNKMYERDYTAFSIEGEVYLVFNDDPNAVNNKRKLGDKNRNNDATYIVNIKPDGTLKRDVLIASKQLGSYTFDPHKKLQIMDNNKIAFIASKNIRNKKTMMGYFSIRKS